MTGYLVSFSIYTLAMIGVIFTALFVFKKVTNNCFSKKSSMLNVEDTMALSPRKTLYVIKAEDERFLIAADIDKTSLIAKLDNKSENNVIPLREDKSLQLNSFDGIETLSEFSSVIDFGKKQEKKGPVMKELAKKLSTM